MVPEGLQGLLWLLLLLGPLFLAQRSLHREIQAVFLLITRRLDFAIVLFSLLFFPGVLLHETSHYGMARLLGVRTGRFSLLPRPLPNGRLQLGFVETQATDWLRETLIGAAPLLTGGLLVAYAGVQRLGLTAAWEALSSGVDGAFPAALSAMFDLPDFWLWFYLAIAVSSTMLPSASDRRAWLPLGLTAALLLGIGLLAGAGPWLLANAAPYLNRALEAAALVLAISLALHVVLLPPFWLARRGLSRLSGLEVA